TVHLAQVDGIMIGRAAYESPYLLADVDHLFGGSVSPAPSRHLIATRMIDYLAHEVAAGTPPIRILRHTHGLFQGEPGARRWRQTLTRATDPSTAVRVVQEFLDSA
ncbi:MAG: tRNA-dihydrouridine synthase A, partial [Rhodospirillaceae bacterium]